MLELKGLVAGYGGVRILHDVSLTVGATEMVALLGSNGVGKSTVMKTISGLLRSTEGSIKFEGREISRTSPEDIVEAGLVLVPEGRRLFNGMSVQDNLLIGNTVRHALPRRKELLDKVFELFPVLALRRLQAAGTLSGGEQQMVAIGRALMAAPKLLMLDEPSLGLAPALTHQVFEALRVLNKEPLAILVVEQNVSIALAACERGYVLEDGSITVSDTAEAMRKDDGIRKAYLGM
ncbi:ABC transporter ATP-binding protein [Pontivivens nitratireducens]|uniref:ABC transporter ATP-binding protein n=1 Tax=Pontivivens nitratireducens TaxID=2758038 RepID=A0A6G7VNR7_9RHOB|nr:ABC transporter ATP-binding protein [Pontibrevibacter nitratireducens]QIK41562.1 ABC transporter ATP-binding protein [Pontibrevibacter nitratireducens]